MTARSLNAIDAVGLEKRAKKLKLPFFKISGATGEGIPALLEAMWSHLADAREAADAAKARGETIFKAGRDYDFNLESGLALVGSPNLASKAWIWAVSAYCPYWASPGR